MLLDNKPKKKQKKNEDNKGNEFLQGTYKNIVY